MDTIRRNNVNVTGSGKPIMFAHGFGCDQNMWRHVAPSFQKEFQTILFDHVGSGKSDESKYNPRKYSTLHGYADDVIEILDVLKVRDVIFVGHSVSAMIGILAANKRPDLFSRMVLVGPSPCYINKEDYFGGFIKSDIEGLLDSLDGNYLGWSINMAPAIMGNPERPELSEELTNSFCRVNPDIAKHFARVTFLSDNRKDLPSLSIPSLILQCSEDIIAPEAVGRYVAETVQYGVFYQMKARGHCPNLSAPVETVAAIRAFL